MVINLVGFLFGFDNHSSVCKNYTNKIQTNFEYYYYPIAPYACKEDSGLLQPAALNAFNWLGERHNK